jgi:hypothetical protein
MAGDFEKLERSVFARIKAGEMTIRQASPLLQGFQEMRRTAAGGPEQQQINQMDRFRMQEKTVQKAFEDGLKSGGEELFKFQEMLGLTNTNLEKFSGTISSIVSGATQTQGISNAGAAALGVGGGIIGSILGYKSGAIAKFGDLFALRKVFKTGVGEAAAKEAAEAAAKAGEKGIAEAAIKGVKNLQQRKLPRLELRV